MAGKKSRGKTAEEWEEMYWDERRRAEGFYASLRAKEDALVKFQFIGRRARVFLEGCENCKERGGVTYQRMVETLRDMCGCYVEEKSGEAVVRAERALKALRDSGEVLKRWYEYDKNPGALWYGEREFPALILRALGPRGKEVGRVEIEPNHTSMVWSGGHVSWHIHTGGEGGSVAAVEIGACGTTDTEVVKLKKRKELDPGDDMILHHKDWTAILQEFLAGIGYGTREEP